MTTYRYFTKDALIEAAKAGNERGYNRQLDADKLADLEWTKFLPITFSMPHEHIAGELVEPHIRAMVRIGPEDNDSVMIDISTDRYAALPTYDSETKIDSAEFVTEAGEGQHRTPELKRR